MIRPVSIQDIAHAAGVSHTTVSRALRDSPLISTSVRLTIQQLARELGYTSNAVAQSLKGRRSNTIGLVVTSIADPFNGRVVRGVDEVASQAGVDVFLGVSDNDASRELAVIESFHRRRVDGIISTSSRLSDAQSHTLDRIGVPIVLINRQSESDRDLFRTVMVDSYSGARQAMDHLVSLGHSAIAYLGASNRPQSNRRRKQGYLDGLEAANITIRQDWVHESPEEHQSYAEDVADGQALMFDALRAGITAAFCYNDMFAIGALMTCRAFGLSVPDQLSLVGFDDVDVAQYVTPPLTTVRQPKRRLGQLAMEMLLSRMHDCPTDNHVLPVELIVRSSTAPAPPMVFRVTADSRRPVPSLD